MLPIYTPYITNRIKYVMQYVFEERLGIEYSITSDKQQFILNTTHFKIIYANEKLENGIFFYAHSLLFENDIKKTEVDATSYNQIKILFAHNNNSALPFDVFAAIFYLLSRYEEYLNEPLDKFENYDYRNSILFKQNILDVPVIEQWIELLKKVLLQYFPSLQFKIHTPKFALSFDIDVAYAYKNRNIFRTFGGLLKKIFQLNINEAKKQLSVLSNKKKDMFDTYDYIFTSLKNKKPIFFFNMGEYGRFDKNPSSKNKKFQALIKDISQKAIVGLHPSYASNSNQDLITSEKNKLEKIIAKQITASRQHYLKLKLPYTYNNLISNNITQDFTIGYSANYGFRAGTCNSFLFFDLINNETTSLRLFPFSYMDGTLNNYLNLNLEGAKKTVSQLIQIVYKYNGVFIPLWHNSTLSNCADWKGWREVFEHTLKEIDTKIFENLLK
ncbi:MAG: polysaccharide deacetylase family protein [Parafilimonas sp.]